MYEKLKIDFDSKLFKGNWVCSESGLLSKVKQFLNKYNSLATQGKLNFMPFYGRSKNIRGKSRYYV